MNTEQNDQVDMNDPDVNEFGDRTKRNSPLGGCGCLLLLVCIAGCAIGGCAKSCICKEKNTEQLQQPTSVLVIKAEKARG